MQELYAWSTKNGRQLGPISYNSPKNVFSGVKFYMVFATCILHSHAKFHAD